MEAWGFEISASLLLVVVEVEDVEAWHSQAAFAVRVPVSEELEYVEALHVGGDFAVGLLVGVELEDVEASHSEGVAERSVDAEVEDVELRSEAASVVGFPESVEAVDVETLHWGADVVLLVSVEVEDVEALCLRDAVECFEDAEIEQGAVELCGNSEGLLEDVEFEGAAALQWEASAVENLVVVEATQAFELAFGSSGCFRDLDSAFFLQDFYSLLDQESEPLLEMGLETDEAADCQRVRGWDRAATFEVLEDDAETRLLRAEFGHSQEVGRVFQHLELDAELALLVCEAPLH